MTDAETTNVEVTYREAEPQKIAVETVRDKEFSYRVVYVFEMVGSTAELMTIKSDGDSYPVKANECTRDAARESVSNLPFVQGVVMIE
jgi:ribosomal protein L25 (general stress protein Ctc)